MIKYISLDLAKKDEADLIKFSSKNMMSSDYLIHLKSQNIKCIFLINENDKLNVVGYQTIFNDNPVFFKDKNYDSSLFLDYDSIDKNIYYNTTSMGLNDTEFHLNLENMSIYELDSFQKLINFNYPFELTFMKEDNIYSDVWFVKIKKQWVMVAFTIRSDRSNVDYTNPKYKNEYNLNTFKTYKPNTNFIDNDNINGNAKTKRDKMEVINLILDKINNYGFDTLSTNELFILEKYSKEI